MNIPRETFFSIPFVGRRLYPNGASSRTQRAEVFTVSTRFANHGGTWLASYMRNATEGVPYSAIWWDSLRSGRPTNYKLIHRRGAENAERAVFYHGDTEGTE